MKKYTKAMTDRASFSRLYNIGPGNSAGLLLHPGATVGYGRRLLVLLSYSKTVTYKSLFHSQHFFFFTLQ